MHALSFPSKTKYQLNTCDLKNKKIATECTFVSMFTQPITLSNTKLNYTTKAIEHIKIRFLIQWRFFK
ncbi:hypothetical protein PCORN_01465 [Listeria cornellensis FSL F6-0969]|uniref:Uncharacterized protein n=1 Tax=Listeria cornellensis FSL F6-0969 TaxID=1265820 RepID=W7C6A8_9LIST|nr:hypothetical protein PCORN_01465 [Listeria cornellensis FSL F6-0969]